MLNFTHVELLAKELSMPEKPKISELTRRERQIMEVIYRFQQATAMDIVENLPGKPVNATIRTMLGVLEDKGYVKHVVEKGKFIYSPTIPLSQARKTALDNVLDTFFRGAEASAVISILKKSDANLSEKDAEMIVDLINRSKTEGR